MDTLQNFLLYFAMIQTVVWLTRITSSFSQSNCYAPKETICKRYLPFIENGDLANDVLFIMLSSFSLDKAESSPPSVHYYITNLLPTCCRNSKNPAHFYLCGIFVIENTHYCYILHFLKRKTPKKLSIQLREAFHENVNLPLLVPREICLSLLFLRILIIERSKPQILCQLK